MDITDNMTYGRIRTGKAGHSVSGTEEKKAGMVQTKKGLALLKTERFGPRAQAGRPDSLAGENQSANRLGLQAVPVMGLTSQEVAERTKQGLTNHTDITTGKTVPQILKSNIFTYFNFIFLVLSVLLCMAESYRNLSFLPIVVGNAVIGMIQELRAKRTLDRMNMLHAPQSVVVRNQVQSRIPSEELVKDDVVCLSAGNQICADAVVVYGSAAVNESLLTGEADEVQKEVGSRLLSGSFVVSGQCYAKLERVGKESYISKLTAEAKAMGSGEQSKMIRSVNQLVKWVGILIIPAAAVLFAQAYFSNGETFQKSIVSMVAAVIGMIPEGLYLLMTAALALSTVRLAQKKVLLHDMKSIETLARVDVLCVDKTGTITEPDMRVKELIPAGTGQDRQELEQLLADYSRAVPDNNATMQAIRAYAPLQAVSAKRGAAKERAVLSAVPFSSEKKYSMVTFADAVYRLGAPEFVMGDAFASVQPKIQPYVKKGCRVLAFAKQTEEETVIPLCFIRLENPIRKNAKETFSYFVEQGVTVKVISGDHPQTVSEVAKQAGILQAERYIDAGTLKTQQELEEAAERYTVFGRVSPKQKRQLVKALQKAGHTAAMTGDGVNDILAMKDADCSVAMASGSEAAAQAAQVVLLDSDFAHMPHVVLEGRRVVNNIERSASLFLVKNIFSLLMALFAALFAFTYPLEPAQISLVGMFTIGVPGFLLALEPNKNRIRGNFIQNVLTTALPAGLANFLTVAAFVIFATRSFIPEREIATACALLLAAVGFSFLIRISRPLNGVKCAILALNLCGLAAGGVFLNQLFAMSSLSGKCIGILLVFLAVSQILFLGLSKLIGKGSRT